MPAPGDQHSSSGGRTIHNPFEEVKPRISEYTAQEIASLQSRLEKQLGPEYISSRAGPSGQKVHYLAAEKCIQLANEVFGFNGWSSSIQQLQVDFMDEHPSTFKVSLGLSVIVRVTLKDGTYHEDIGYGHIENCKGKAAAFEKAKKEGTTDALKRALRNFGNVLGNCIYDKDYVSKVTKIKVQPTKWDVDGLHRHHDYVPVKKELVDCDHLKQIDMHPIVHADSMEDEFGDFDDADFGVPSDPDGHPDEVVLPAPNPNPQRTGNGSVNHQRQMNPTNTTMPAPKFPQPRPHAQQMSRSSTGPPNQPQTLNGALARSNSGVTGSIQRAGHLDGVANVARVQLSNPHHSRVLNQPSRNGPVSAPVSPGLSRPIDAVEDDNLAAMATGPVGSGFFSARLTRHMPEIVENAAPPPSLASVPIFDIHAESPSLKKTPGIDHKSTKPLTRDLTAISGPAPQSNVGAGAMRTTVINSHFENTRRIGAPGSPSPMGNRGSYKPPTMKRPSEGTNAVRGPLVDMPVNGALVGDGGDGIKRQRLNGP